MENNSGEIVNTIEIENVKENEDLLEKNNAKFHNSAGASGGDRPDNEGGLGGYVKFEVDITNIDNFYLEVGEKGVRTSGGFGYGNGGDGEELSAMLSGATSGGGGSTGLEADGELIAEAGGGSGGAESSSRNSGEGGGVIAVGGSPVDWSEDGEDGEVYVDNEVVTIIEENVNDDLDGESNGFVSLFVDV